LCLISVPVFANAGAHGGRKRPPEIIWKVRAGEKIRDLCRRLEREGACLCTHFESTAKSADLSFIPRSEKTLRKFEGIFVPGEYRIEKIRGQDSQTRSARILGSLLAAARTRYDHSDLEGNALYHRITIASIVEKESVKKENFEEVASVFFNRLRTGQTLGSCPTVEYALGYHRPFLLESDVRIQSPYNVYRNKGLPPTPIAFFSEGAWNAALHPKETEYQFFVFDWTTGKLGFSKSYEEHKDRASRARANFIRRFGAARLHAMDKTKYYEY
ncbi:MAG TPA: endolytic transglycosylase MltG, partial [Leptospiraceae bacterium]|nr:endolytic transglycosylase MltG [Leptospiraceae bacterium]